MPLPSKRDPEELARRLESWFTRDSGAPCSIGDVAIPEGTGMSSETLLATLHAGGSTHRIVIRLAPDMSDWPVFPVYDLQAQAGAMNLAGRFGVPVPVVRAVEEDTSILGSPFLVMDRVDGRALPDMPPYVFGGSYMDELDVEDQRRLSREVAALLARIHAIDLDQVRRSDLDTSFLAPFDRPALDRLLDQQQSYYDWARGDMRLPIIERAISTLRSQQPERPGPTVLNWGDARPGNVLFDGLVPTAVLDWEMVDVGPAGIDVGWLIFMHTFFQSLADVFQLPGFPDFCRSDDIVEAYVAAGGSPIDDLDWYVRYASLRFAAIAIRTSLREVAYGNRDMPDDPEDLIMHKAMLYEQFA